jgi:hypothetical protein
VDLATGEVIEVINLAGAPLLFVNSSIDRFTHVVKGVMARFPYYAASADDADWQAASRDLTAIIGQIDPPAVVPDRYWSTFLDDVEMGDLSTEAVEAVINR